MPAYRLTVPTGGALSSTETIGPEWFGAIQTGFHPFEGFDRAASALDVGLVRWPGGTLSELRTEVYGLEHAGLFDATDLWRHDPRRDRPDLEETMDYAIDNDMAFSVIIPTVRYKDDLATGETHLRSFLDDLFTGKYGAMPENFTLELGNEYFALPDFRDDPAAYGKIASSFAEIIAESAALHLTPAERAGLKVAVQMGGSTPDNDAILGAFSTEGLAATNSLVFHSLPISLRNLNKENPDENGMTRFEQWDARADQWGQAIADAGGTTEPELFLSAWTVGNSTHDPSMLSLEWQEYGLRSASVAVETVAGYSSIGVDAAAVWGLDVTNLNAVTTTGPNGELVLSHTGEIFDMMSDSLPGATYLGTFSPHAREDDVMSWVFGQGDRLTAYVSINEFNATNDDVLLDFGGAQNLRLVSAEMLSADLDPGFGGSITDPEARLHEIPVRYDIHDLFSRDGLLIDFSQSYELAEIVVELGDGPTGTRGSDWITGGWTSDTLYGHGGDDFLVGGRGYDRLLGGKGDDRLYGEAGDDRLYGNFGNDTLSGGDGDDILGGGAGRDVLIGGRGNDTFQFGDESAAGVIRDFQHGSDLIDLRGVLQDAGGLTLRSDTLQETLGRGGVTGGTYEMTFSQSGTDAILRVLDASGAQRLSLRVRNTSANDLAADHDSVFSFGAGFGSAANGGLPLPISLPNAVPAPAPSTPDASPTPAATDATPSWFDRLKTFIDPRTPAGGRTEAPGPGEQDYILEATGWNTDRDAPVQHHDHMEPVEVSGWMDAADDPVGDMDVGAPVASSLFPAAGLFPM